MIGGNKLAFADIGELGWSLYLSAHIRWLKENRKCLILVCTYADRKCLYSGLADIVRIITEPLLSKFAGFPKECFGLRGVSSADIKNDIQSIIPSGFSIPHYFEFSCKKVQEVKFSPYPTSKFAGMLKRKRILIFPRYRKEEFFCLRNISKVFYVRLVDAFVKRFPDNLVTIVGTPLETCEISASAPNFEDRSRIKRDVQDFIDLCSVSVAAVGGQSSLPKISLLRGVPTYIIGHEKYRHVCYENWRKTASGFYSISLKEYNTFCDQECISSAVAFVSRFVR